MAKSQGFEQILPSRIRTGPSANANNSTDIKTNTRAVPPTTIIDEASPPVSPQSETYKRSGDDDGPGGSPPSILAPQPTTSRFLQASSPASEYPVRSVSPDFVPDRMADRIADAGLAALRLTPNPEAQVARVH